MSKVIKIRGNAATTKGTAFVVYEDIFDAKNACEHLSGFNVCNRYLVVLYYQPHKVRLCLGMVSNVRFTSNTPLGIQENEQRTQEGTDRDLENKIWNRPRKNGQMTHNTRHRHQIL